MASQQIVEKVFGEAEHRNVPYDSAIYFEGVKSEVGFLLKSNALRQRRDKIAAEATDADVHFLQLVGWSGFREDDFIILLEEHIHGFGNSIYISFGVDALFHSRQYDFRYEALLNLAKKHAF